MFRITAGTCIEITEDHSNPELVKDAWEIFLDVSVHRVVRKIQFITKPYMDAMAMGASRQARYRGGGSRRARDRL